MLPALDNSGVQTIETIAGRLVQQRPAISEATLPKTRSPPRYGATGYRIWPLPLSFVAK
jgi:hypothetical protein